jgi:hypothetical protein
MSVFWWFLLVCFSPYSEAADKHYAGKIHAKKLERWKVSIAIVLSNLLSFFFGWRGGDRVERREL